MAGKVNYRAVINELQRTMALKESGAERLINSAKRHAGCEGHGCNASCGYHGYCDYEATRYYNASQGKIEGRRNKNQRHDYYRREMRL